MATQGKYPQLKTMIDSNEYQIELLRAGDIKFRYERNSAFTPVEEVIETGLSGTGLVHLGIEIIATTKTVPVESAVEVLDFLDAEQKVTAQVLFPVNSTEIAIKILRPEYPGDSGKWIYRIQQKSPHTFLFGNATGFTYDKLQKLKIASASNVRIHRLVITVY